MDNEKKTLVQRKRIARRYYPTGSPEHNRMLENLFHCIENNKPDEFKYKGYNFTNTDIIMVLSHYSHLDSRDDVFVLMLKCFFPKKK